MDNCTVCLTTNTDMGIRIYSISIEWQECNIQRIIEKYLWWWYSKQSSVELQWICRKCWEELLSFHTFCTRIEKAHRQYEILNVLTVEKCSTPVNIEQNINTSSLIAKEERQIFNDLLPLATYIRKRKARQNQIDFSRNTERETKVQTAVAIQQDDKIKNLKIEPAKEPDYDNYKNNSWKENNTNNNEEIGSENGIELLVVKEEFQISEDTFTANNKDLVHFDVSKSIDATKDPELCCMKDKTENNENKEENKPSKERVGKSIKDCTKKLEGNSKSKRAIKTPKLENRLKNNEYLKQSSYKFTCHLCKMPLSDFLTLKHHYRSEHSMVGYAVCCNKRFYSRAILVDHLRVHEDPNYFKCPSCDKIMSNRTTFETHVAAYHKIVSGEKKDVYKCDKCDKLFVKKALYDRHIFLHLPDEERKFKCDECNKKFGSEALVKVHKDFTHLNKYCKICEICGKSFRDRFYFNRHMNEHNGKPTAKVPCDICGVELTNKYLLNRHKKNMHTEENQREQICPHCSKVSLNLLAHRHHIFYTHTLKRKHACHICEKRFKSTLKLKEHLSTHTREPLFTCNYCPRTFISKSNMYKHRKNDHPKEWQAAKEIKK